MNHTKHQSNNDWTPRDAIGIVVQTPSSTELNEYVGDLVFITDEKCGWYRAALYKPTRPSEPTLSSSFPSSLSPSSSFSSLPSSPTSPALPSSVMSTADAVASVRMSMMGLSSSSKISGATTMGFIRSNHVFILSELQSNSVQSSCDAFAVDHQMNQLKKLAANSDSIEHRLDLISESKYFKSKMRKPQLFNRVGSDDGDDGGDGMFPEWRIPLTQKVLEIIYDWRMLLRHLIESEENFESLMCILSELARCIRIYRNAHKQENSNELQSQNDQILKSMRSLASLVHEDVALKQNEDVNLTSISDLLRAYSNDSSISPRRANAHQDASTPSTSSSPTVASPSKLTNRLSQGYMLSRGDTHRSIRNITGFLGAQLKLQLSTSNLTNNAQETVKEFTNIQEGNHQLMIQIDPCTFTNQFNIHAEAHLSLYSAKKKQTVSEQIIVGQSSQVAHRILIRDLDENDFKSELYLVAKVYRVGAMLRTSTKLTKEKSALELKRPYGCSILELSPVVVSTLMSGGRFTSDTLQMYITSKEDEFASLHDVIIHQKVASYDFAPQHELERGLTIGLRVQSGHYNDVVKIGPEWGSLKSCRMLHFPSAISPGDMRNDIYITMANAAFKSTKLRSVLVEAKVLFRPFNPHDKPAPIKCIIGGVHTNSESDMSDSYSAPVYYHVKNPSWNDMFKIGIAPEDLDKATVVFLFTDIAGKQSSKGTPFGIASWKVTEKGGSFNLQNRNMSNDGLFTMPVYKYSKQLEENIHNFNENDEHVSKLLTKHTLSVQHTIVSTRVSKNEDIRNLLNWRKVSTPKKEILDRFLFCPMQEKVALLREIFDAMFEILDQYDQKEVSLLIYEAIVEIICSLVSHSQFDHFKHVMDEYVTVHFKSIQAQKWFLYFLIQNLNKMDELSMAAKVRESIKAMDYLFKFIVRSRTLYLAAHKVGEIHNDEEVPLEKTSFYIPKHKRSESAMTSQESPDLDLSIHITEVEDHSNRAEFAEDNQQEQKLTIKDVDPKNEYQKKFLYAMERLYELMNSQKNILVGAQANLFKYAGGIFDSFVEIFDAEQSGYLTLTFLNEIPRSSSSKSSLTQYKLNLITQVVKSRVFSNNKSRMIVLPKVIEETQYHIHRSYSERISCIQILKGLFDSIQVSIQNQGLHSVSDCLFLMFALVSNITQAFDEMNVTIAELKQSMDALKKSETTDVYKGSSLSSDVQSAERAKSDLFSFMLTFVNLYRLEGSIDYHLTRDEEVASGISLETIRKFVQMNKILIQNHSLIKNSFISLKSLMYEAVLQNMRSVAKNAQKRLLFSEKFDIELWNSWLSVMFTFIFADFIQVESFTKYRQMSNNRLGDLRLSCVEIIVEFWNDIDNRRSSFIPSIINSIMNLLDVRNEEMHKRAVQFYYDVVKYEYQTSNSIELCEDVTQRCVLERTIDDMFRNSFIDGLESLFKKDESMNAIGFPFLSRLNTMLADVVKVQQYGNNEDLKIQAIVQIMESLKFGGNRELYFKYIHILSDSHIKFGNHIEAALALKLHYDALSWDRKVILPYFSGKYPEETSFQRREKIVKDMISLLSEGSDFERAIGYCKELCDIYQQNKTYAKIRDVMKNEGSFYTQIISTERIVPRYFYARYYGQGFKQMGLTGDAFVYRGKPLEKQIDFTNRLLRLYPGSVILKEEPDDSLDDEPGMFIHAFIVLPVENKAMIDKFTENKVHPNIAKYSLMTHIAAVQILRKTKEDSQELNKVYGILETELPGIRRGVRVTSISSHKPTKQ